MAVKPKTPRDATLQDLLSTPEGVWQEAPQGFELTVIYEKAKDSPGRVVIPISKKAAVQLRAIDGETVRASVRRGKLVLERSPRRRARHAPRA
jgi:hypothetical protein